MTIALGFDFGLKKVGVAVGQSITQTASPVEIIKVLDGELPDTALAKLIKDWQPDVIIVGIPLNMDGTTSIISERAEAFAKSIETRCKIPVYRVDERLSTRNAHYEIEQMTELTKVKRKDHRVDAFAACLIIETWLQYGGMERGPQP